MLGDLLLTGRGTAADLVAARAWYEKAARTVPPPTPDYCRCLCRATRPASQDDCRQYLL